MTVLTELLKFLQLIVIFALLGWVARVSEMAGGAQSWKKFVPYDVAPIIAAMGFVTCLASYRIFSIARLPDVKFTKNGGTHDWQERVSADSQDKQNEEHA